MKKPRRFAEAFSLFKVKFVAFLKVQKLDDVFKVIRRTIEGAGMMTKSKASNVCGAMPRRKERSISVSAPKQKRISPSGSGRMLRR